jgi:hypothetical protein
MLFFWASRPVVLPVPSFKTITGTVPPPLEDILFSPFPLYTQIPWIPNGTTNALI